MPLSLPTTEDYKAYLRIEMPTEEDSDIDGVRLSTESLIRKVSGRSWTIAGDAATTRFFAPRADRQDLVRIFDCVAVTAVTNDGESVPLWTRQTGGYQLEPLNGLDWTGEPRPFESVRYINKWWKFDGYRQTVAVTARWGWAEIPEQVVRAHYVIAKDMWLMRRQDQIAAGFEEVLEAKAKLLLKGYRREEAKAGIGGAR